MKTLSALAGAAIVVSTGVAASAQPASPSSSPLPLPLPSCSASDEIVWYVPSTKTYFRHGSVGYGTRTGSFVCRSTVVKRAQAAPMTTPPPITAPGDANGQPQKPAGPRSNGPGVGQTPPPR